MKNNLQPKTLQGIRSFAKDLKKDRGIKHSDALNIVAKNSGFENYAHAQKDLSLSPQSFMGTVRPLNSKNLPKKMKEFHQLALTQWAKAVASVNSAQSDSLEWTSTDQIADVLNYVLGATNNDTNYPTGGGMDFDSVEVSQEKDCIELVHEHGSRHLLKPRRLVLEFIKDNPGESFLYLETKTINPVSFAKIDDETESFYRSSQQVVRIGNNHYPRSYWDEHVLGYEDNGDAIPLPDSAHLLRRWESGNFMFISKGSIWNAATSTDQGFHNDYSIPFIRETIIKGITKLSA